MTVLAGATKGVAGNANGNIVVDDNHVILMHHNTNTGNFSTLAVATGDAAPISGFAVPTGKTLFIYSSTVYASVASTQHIFFVGFGDTDVNFNSASAPTSSKNAISGGVLNSGSNAWDRTITAIGDEYTVALNWETPAGKFPAIYTSVGGSVIAYYYGRLV